MWITYRWRILPPDQNRAIEQATYSPSGKAFEKQIKTIGIKVKSK